jgi:hypothetical protein
MTCDAARTDADTHGCAPTQCTEGYTCPADTRCQAGAGQPDSHGCVPVLCTEGYTCPGTLECLPDATKPDGHGCAVVTCDGVSCAANQVCHLTYGVSAICDAKTCQTDDDCDCGVCINPTLSVYGNCAPRLSICIVSGQGGAQGAAGGFYGGGGGVTGSGGVVVDSGLGGAGGSIDAEGNGQGG